MKESPFISVVIPVFGTENVLHECLESVAAQNFEDFEIIVVNDGSGGTDENGNGCRKIVKQFQKEQKKLKKKPVLEYLEHDRNKGLLEARRTGVYGAKGRYILNLDSDDRLPPDALCILAEEAEKSGAMIIHGKGDVTGAGNRLEYFEEMSAKTGSVFCGQLKGPEIFDSWFMKKTHAGFMWGKLIDRELYLKALDQIPFTFCTMGEDLLQYFFISYFAESYSGLERCVYHYSVAEGISSGADITDLRRWEKVCSTASVFTVLFQAVEEGKVQLSEEQIRVLKLKCRGFLKNNLLQLENAVDSSIKQEAYGLLCEYWGEKFVEEVKNSSF